MQPILINNFCEGQPLQLRTIAQTDAKPLIAFTQFSGGMTFNHAMSIDQAKDMAKQILKLAYAIELDATHE